MLRRDSTLASTSPSDAGATGLSSFADHDEQMEKANPEHPAERGAGGGVQQLPTEHGAADADDDRDGDEGDGADRVSPRLPTILVRGRKLCHDAILRTPPAPHGRRPRRLALELAAARFGGGSGQLA
jgi:hypothetical protein